MYTMKDFMEDISLLDKYMEDMHFSDLDRKINREFVIWCKRIYSMVDAVNRNQAEALYNYFQLGLKHFFERHRRSLYRIWDINVSRLEIALRVMVGCRLTSFALECHAEAVKTLYEGLRKLKRESEV